MKTYIGILLFWTTAGYAAPKLDVATGTETPIIVTVVPDHQDPNLYYFFPTSYRISEHEGKLQFTYYETKGFWGVTGAYAAMTMSANFDRQSLETKVREIKAQNPNAHFSPITVLSSTISQMLTLPGPTLEEAKCQPQGNMLGQDVGCELVIRVKAREVFIKVIRRNLTNVLSLTYSFAAMVNGEFREITHSLPIIFGDVGSGNYFFDGDGNPIRDEVLEEYKELLQKREQYIRDHNLEACLQEVPPSAACGKKLSNSKWKKIEKRLAELRTELRLRV